MAFDWFCGILLDRSRMMKRDAEHIKLAVNCFQENTTKTKKIRQYLFASI